MSVKKIFMTLITIVCCVIVGALILNVLLPNVTNSLIFAAEDMVRNATGMSFDFNGDGTTGTGAGSDGNFTGMDSAVTDGGVIESTGVEGFNTGN